MLKGLFQKSTAGCNCGQCADLESPDALDKRVKKTEEITRRLDKIAEKKETGDVLYQCAKCRQYWQLSLDWMRGNAEYVYKVPPIERAAWQTKPFVKPGDLFSLSGRIQHFLKGATFVEKPEKCAKDNCDEQAIRFSGLCAFHHLINIGFQNQLPDDRTWFPPFEKDHYEFTITRLKQLPNYQPLSSAI